MEQQWSKGDGATSGATVEEYGATVEQHGATVSAAKVMEQQVEQR